MPAVLSARPRPLHFAALVMNPAGHVIQGTWRRALARQADSGDLEHSVRLAMTLERGGFDAVFFADAVQHHASCRPGEPGYRETGLQAPGGDLSVLAGAIAYATRHLGIALTASILQEHPFHFARRISTLDHASKGRIAWNIVADDVPDAWLKEYADVTYKLWEGSWEEDALGRDDRADSHSGAGKVHRINHRGPQYKVERPHLGSPSPQRTRCCSGHGRPRQTAPSRPGTPRWSSPSPPAWPRPPARGHQVLPGPAGAGPDATGVRRGHAQAQALRPRRPAARAASRRPLPRRIRAAARLRRTKNCA